MASRSPRVGLVPIRNEPYECRTTNLGPSDFGEFIVGFSLLFLGIDYANFSLCGRRLRR